MTISLKACRKAGLSTNASLLLNKISWWYPKAKAEFAGTRFIAKTRETWCEETGLSQAELRRALETLKTHKLIQVERHKFGGQTISFMRPLITEDVDLSGTISAHRPMRSGASAPIHNGVKSPMHTGQKEPIYSGVKRPFVSKKREIHTERHTGNCMLAIAPCVPSNDNGKSETGKDAPMTTVASVHADLLTLQQQTRDAVKKVQSTSTELERPTQLYEVWRKSLVSLNEHVGPMTGKDAGLFKTIATCAPQGSAREMLAYLVPDWSSFIATLEADYGVYKPSQKPRLDMVAKYCNQAVTWWKERVADDEAYERKQTESAAAKKANTEPPKAASPGSGNSPPVNASKAAQTAKTGGFGPKQLSPLERFQQLVMIVGNEKQARVEWLATHGSLPDGIELLSEAA